MMAAVVGCLECQNFPFTVTIAFSILHRLIKSLNVLFKGKNPASVKEWPHQSQSLCSHKDSFLNERN